LLPLTSLIPYRLTLNHLVAPVQRNDFEETVKLLQKSVEDLQVSNQNLERRLNMALSSATSTTTLGNKILLRLETGCSTKSFEKYLISENEVRVQSLWESWKNKKVKIPTEFELARKVVKQNKELDQYQPIATALFEHLAPPTLKIWSNKGIRNESKRPDLVVTGAREGSLCAERSIIQSELKLDFQKHKLHLYGQLQDYVVAMLKSQPERTVGFGVALDLHTIQILRWDYSTNPETVEATDEEPLLPKADDRMSPVPTSGFSLLARLLHTDSLKLGFKQPFAAPTITIESIDCNVIERWTGGHSEVYSVEWNGERIVVKIGKESYDLEARNIETLKGCPAVPEIVANYTKMLLLKPSGTPLSTVLDPVQNLRVPTASLYLLGAVLVRRLGEIHRKGLLHLDFRPRNLILRTVQGI